MQREEYDTYLGLKTVNRNCLSFLRYWICRPGIQSIYYKYVQHYVLNKCKKTERWREGKLAIDQN